MPGKYAVNLFWLLLLLTGSLFAVDAKVRVFIPSDKAVYTSQKVTVAVELLSNAFSITDASIRFPSTERYIVQAPQSAAYIGKEEIDDEDWQMVHYEYAVYPLRAGKIALASIPVSFTASVGYGQPKKRFDLRSEALHFDVKVPKGVKNDQFVLVTDRYKVTSERDPMSTRLVVGDAVTLTVTQEARGVPDILLPPIVYTSGAFLRVYDKEPELQSGMKGEYDVSRTDSFTFVAGQEGNVTVPARKMLWWNSRTEEVQKAVIPEMHFEIIPDPQIAIDAKNKVRTKRITITLISVLILLLVLLWSYPKIKKYLSARKHSYRESEKGKFNILVNSVQSGDITRVYSNFYRWIESLDSKIARGGFAALSKMYPEFKAELGVFETALATPERDYEAKRLIRLFKALRTKLCTARAKEESGLESMLNP